MPNRTQHVIYHPDGGWSVKKGGAVRATRRFKTRKEAISYAVKVSRKQGAELYIHRADGLVGEKYSYGPTSHPPRGSL